MTVAWWERQDPATFLRHDWANPSRAVGTAWAREAADGGVILEVGPGAGVDYAKHFRASVLAGLTQYIGSEPTTRFRESLQARFPEVSWWDLPITALGEGVATVTYARAVLEHQPVLEPALTALLRAASKACVVDWYRPPERQSVYALHDGVHYHTYAMQEAQAVIDSAGWAIAERHAAISGNEVWRMEPLQ